MAIMSLQLVIGEICPRFLSFVSLMLYSLMLTCYSCDLAMHGTVIFMEYSTSSLHVGMTYSVRERDFENSK